MRFFDRLRKGWDLGITSLSIIRENMSLLLFPVLSSLALLLVTASFFGGFLIFAGIDLGGWINEGGDKNEMLLYLGLFAFYLVTYFIIVFFNVGLVHCARLVFEGREASINDGLQYAASRIDTVLSWALLAATVGVVLRIVEDRLGWVGQLIAGIVGVVWSVATFFVVPVIAYENVGPVEALKRSGRIMKEKWGEAIGANFSFGLFFILGYIVIISLGILLFQVHPLLGIIPGILSILLLHVVVAAARSVFIAATYNHLSNQPAGQFDEQGMLNELFVPK